MRDGAFLELVVCFAAAFHGGIRVAALDEAAHGGIRFAVFEEAFHGGIRVEDFHGGIRVAALDEAAHGGIRFVAFEEAVHGGMRFDAWDEAVHGGIRLEFFADAVTPAVAAPGRIMNAPAAIAAKRFDFGDMKSPSEVLSSYGLRVFCVTGDRTRPQTARLG